MDDLLQTLRLIISRWTRTVTPTTAIVNSGDIVIHVYNTLRFKKGNNIVFTTQDNQVLAGFFVDEILDQNTIRLTSPVGVTLPIGTNVNKAFNNNFIQGVYLGQPSNLTKFPSVCIYASNESSEWLTLQSTKEEFNVKIGVYVDGSVQEETYLWSIRVAKEIKEGLRRNIYPLVGPYDTYALTADALDGDTFIKIVDTSKLWYPARMYLEDPFNFDELGILSIIDSTTLQLGEPVCGNYYVSNHASIVVPTQFFYNSFPKNITYGEIFKGSMLKANVIDYFADKQRIQTVFNEPNIF